MALSAKRAKVLDPNLAAKKGLAPSASVDATAEAEASLTPELVIALCGPIGSPLHQAADQVENALREFGYLTEKLKLSDLIRINAEHVGIQVDHSTKFSKTESLIKVGDALRLQFGSDILAKLAIAKIGGDRHKEYGEFADRADEANTDSAKQIVGHRICHVIDSIKNQSELDLLRLIYGDALFAIGVFSSLDIRQKNLSRPGGLQQSEIAKLIDTDSGEEFSHGQSVRDTFPRCDFFLRVDEPTVGPTETQAIGQLVEKLRRFFDLIFHAAIVTPTADETAMYAAASAGRNSACLSRQVGAAVTTEAGELLSVGWNDVPKQGGGLYGKPPLLNCRERSISQMASPDERCFAQDGAKCHNDTEKSALAEKIVEILIGKSIVKVEQKSNAVDAMLSDSRLKDLIEFSRAVHAEMHAILGACRVAGDRVVGGKIYVTTYPCHACARHIIAAGISEIYYIEPYRKSLAKRLHGDALTEVTDATQRVRLLQFDGVAPRRFIDLFEAGSRKENGVLDLRKRSEALPATRVSLRAIPRLEEVVVAEVASKHLRFPELVSKESESK